MRKLWRRYRANYRYLFYLTRSDIWTGAVFMPGSRLYAQLRDLRRDLLAG